MYIRTRGNTNQNCSRIQAPKVHHLCCIIQGTSPVCNGEILIKAAVLVGNGKCGEREHVIQKRAWFEKMRQMQAIPLPLPCLKSSGNRGLSIGVIRMPASSRRLLLPFLFKFGPSHSKPRRPDRSGGLEQDGHLSRPKREPLPIDASMVRRVIPTFQIGGVAAQPLHLLYLHPGGGPGGCFNAFLMLCTCCILYVSQRLRLPGHLDETGNCDV